DAARKDIPLDVQWGPDAKVGDKGVVRRTLSIQSDQGTRIPAYLFLPPRKDGQKAPAMLCLHQTASLGKGVVSGLGGKAERNYAVELAERGYVTLAPDYPSFGDYKYEFPAGHGWLSGSRKAVYDNSRGLDFLSTRNGGDGE